MLASIDPALSGLIDVCACVCFEKSLMLNVTGAMLLLQKRAANSSRVHQIWSPGRPPGGAIRCSPLVRERLGLGGWDARLRHGAMRDGLQAPGSTKSASRGVICEFCGAQMRPSPASQVRSNGFPAGSAAVGASPFSPPSLRGVRGGVSREE